MSLRVVVIGAGLAGLAAATLLRARGANVLVLEADAQPGGRTRSETREGFVLDAGAQLASSGDGALHELIAAAGLGAALLPLRPVHVLQVRRGVADLIDATDRRGVARIPGARLHEALRTRRLERLLVRFAEILDPARPEAAARLDDRSLADFARLYFGASVLERWMEPFHTAWSGGDAEADSRVLFLLTCLRRRHAWPGTLRGAIGALIDGLTSGLELRCAARCEQVLPAAGGRLAVHVHGAAAPLEADGVVLATPAPEALRVAAELLAPAERDVLAGARYVPALVLTAACEAPLGPVATRILVPRAEGGPVESLLVEPGGGARAPEGRGLAALVARGSFSAVQLDAADDVVEKELLGVLDGLHPGASSRILFTRLHRHPQARPRFPVGRYHALARLRRVGADRRAAGRRLYLAGDHLLEPSLEGAVRSGLRAADEASSDLGLSKRQSDKIARVAPSPPSSLPADSKRST